MIDYELLGQRLREVRKGKGLLQDEVAAHLCMARTTYVAIEHGQRRITSLELDAFARMMDVPLDFFTKNVEKEQPVLKLPKFSFLTDDEADLIDAYRQHDLKKILEILVR